MSGYDDRRQEEKQPGPRHGAALHAWSTPGARVGGRAWKGWEPAEQAWPGGQPGAAIRKVQTVSSETRRLRLAQNLISPLSSPLLSKAGERDSPESGARRQWPPSAKLSDQGFHQRALTPIERTGRWCGGAFVFLPVAVL